MTKEQINKLEELFYQGINNSEIARQIGVERHTVGRYIKKHNLISPNTIQPGQLYGKLTTIEPTNERDTCGRVKWLCRCECGNLTKVDSSALRRGTTLSCGCLQKEKAGQTWFKDLTGQRFGKLTVLGFEKWLNHNNGHRDRMWRCKCDCGNECVVNHRYLRFGDTESCGCTKSRGNATIMRWLNANHYEYQAEYRFKDLVSQYNNIPYQFDFAIFDNGNLKFLIEYQGNIHFKTTPGGWNNEEALADCQKRDKIKFDYCQKNNISLYYITYEEIIEDRLKEIMNEQIIANN